MCGKAAQSLLISALFCLFLGAVFLIPDQLYPPPLLAGEGWQTRIEVDKQAPVSKVLVSNSALFTLHVKSRGFEHETVESEGIVYSRLKIQGSPYLRVSGKPQIPYVRKLVAVPECEGFDLKVSIKESEKLSGINIYPAPELVKGPEGKFEEKFVRNENTYSRDEFYPPVKAEIKNVFRIRNQRVAEVHIYPLRFNPARREMEFNREMEVEISYRSAIGPVCEPNGPFGRVCEKLLVNYGPEFGIFSDTAERPFLTSGEGTVAVCTTLTQAAANNTDYLIIVGHDLWLDAGTNSLVMQLAQKRADFNGFNVSVIDVDYIATIDDNNDAEEIKASLYTFYYNNDAAHMPDNKLGFILLVGDAYDCEPDLCDAAHRQPIIPPYFVPGDPDNASTDMYFAGYDNLNDCTPDIFIGRLSVDDPGEAAGLIEKIVNYEPHPLTGDPDPWYRKFLFVGGSYDGTHELADECRDAVPPSIVFDEVHKDCKPPSQIAGEIDVKLESGFNIVVEVGHGMNYYWGWYGNYSHCDGISWGVYKPDSYEDINNQGKYPVIYSFSCLTGNIDDPTPEGYAPSPAYNRGEVDKFDCMGERLTVMPNRGAVGFIGYTRNAYTFDIPNTAIFVNDLYQVQGMMGEVVTTYFYDLEWPGNQERLIYIGDPALNPFYVEDQANPSDDIDLAIDQKSLLLTPGSGQDVNIYLTVRNVGVRDASDALLELKEGETLLWDDTIASLPAYHETSCTMTVTVSEIGLHQYLATINADGAIEELNYDNNSGLIQFDYNVDFAVVEGSFERDPEVFTINGQNTLEITVLNQGVVGANDIPVELVEGGETVWSGTIDELQPGEETTVTMNFSVAEAGEHQYHFTVNPGAAIPEYNLENNSDSISVAAMNIRSGFPVELYSYYTTYKPKPAAPTVFATSDDDYKRIVVHAGLISAAGDFVEEIVIGSANYPYYNIPLGNIKADDGRNVVGVYKLPPSGIREIRLYDSSTLDLIASCPFTGLEGMQFGTNIGEETFAYDLDRDGKDEIIYIERNFYSASVFVGYMKIFNHEGSSLTEIAGHVFEETGGVGTYRPLEVAVEDVDFDNIPEIIVLGYYSGYTAPPPTFKLMMDIFRFDGSLALVRHESLDVNGLFGYSNADAVSGNIILNDVNGDDYLDVVACLNDAVAIIDGTDVVNNGVNFTRLSEDNPERSMLCSIDLDGLDNDELILATKRYVRILSVDDLWNLTTACTYDAGELAITSGPLLADIDGDGVMEVVVGEKNSAEGSYFIRVLNEELLEETGWPAVEMFGIADGNLAIEDIDNNGQHEIFFIANTGRRAELYIINNPWSTSGDLYWNLEKGNNQNTNASRRYIKGTFDENLVLCREVEVIADVMVNNPHTLFIAPGTRIYARKGDPGTAGRDVNRIELASKGGIAVNGLDNVEVLCLSREDNPQPLDWFGLILDSSALGAEISYCQVRHGFAGLWVTSSTAAVTVHKSSFKECSMGLNLSYCDPVLTYVNASNNTSVGILVGGYTDNATDPFIDHCTCRTNGSYGMLLAFTAGTVQYSFSENNALSGILCVGANCATEIKHTNIIGNALRGVEALYDASPVLGDISAGKGMNNSIYNSTHYVYQNYSSPGTEIMAQNCYWGTDPGQMPSPTFFKGKFYGNITYWPVLLYDPIYGYPASRQTKPTRVYMSQNYPNPFNGDNTQITYAIPGGNIKVSLRIYDVAGRRVKTLVDGIKDCGTYHVNWDGRNEHGVKVSQGVYFYQLIAGEEKISKKMIFFR
ncbi:MAG: T9SS type A sorting domain-containing protein [Candidatus Krumholzibacteriota bacterium]|nr:T9SS type A sorting domain-containing protein [Candidatus Krumholzibacteriota bacterium]